MSTETFFDSIEDRGMWDRCWFQLTIGLTNAIAWLCLITGIVSLMEVSFSIDHDLHAERFWTATLYWFLFNVTWIYFVVFAIASRIKARIALPLILTCLWTTTGAIPMNLFLPAHAAFLAPTLQILVPGISSCSLNGLANAGGYRQPTRTKFPGLPFVRGAASGRDIDPLGPCI